MPKRIVLHHDTRGGNLIPRAKIGVIEVVGYVFEVESYLLTGD